MSAVVLLIGSGKLARHLEHWFSIHAEYSAALLTWNRHQDPMLLYQYLSTATHVWLAIADAAIIDFYEQYLLQYPGSVVHFSGAIHDDRITCAHPLMSFSEQLYTRNFYSSIYFALTGCVKLTDVLPGFHNPCFILSGTSKPMYHALCVLAGNFPQLLWSAVYRLSQSCHVPQQAFDLYIQKITENFISMKEQAITGPIARKDKVSINKNLEALAGTPLYSIYQSFLQEFLS